MFASWHIFCYFGCCTLDLKLCCTMTMRLKSYCFKTWGKFRKMDTSPSLLALLKGRFIQISYSLWSLMGSFGFTVQVLSLLTSLVVPGNDIKTIQEQHVFLKKTKTVYSIIHTPHFSVKLLYAADEWKVWIIQSNWVTVSRKKKKPKSLSSTNCFCLLGRPSLICGCLHRYLSEQSELESHSRWFISSPMYWGA